MAVFKYGDVGLSKALKRYSDKVEREVKKAVKETAIFIQSEATLRVPSDTGYLEKSITIEVLDGGLKAKVNVGADYAIYVEYGTGIYAQNGNGNKDGWVYYSEKYGEFVFTRGMRPQPFWFPALEDAHKFFEKRIKNLGG